jgi:glycosyltransferase involved in cell wall biosynthesis
MKPRIVNIMADNQLGGVKVTINGLVNSYLATEFDFKVILLKQEPLNIINLINLRPNIIICHQASRFKYSPSLLLMKLLINSAKIIILEHHYSQSYEQFNISDIIRFHRMLKLNYSLANRVVAISQAQAKWMMKNLLIDSNKLTFIRQCIPTEKLLAIQPLPRKEPLSLGAYGRFCNQKGLDTLVKALKLIQHLPIKLYIGGEGSQGKELKQLAQGLKNIEFVGRIDNVPSFLQAVDIVVIPSRWEPWGFVCLEARAAGKPIIAADVDGLTEQVQNCGLLIPPDDPEALAGAIEQVVSLPQTQLQTWGSNGRESVRGAWEQYLSQWRSLLWEVIKK